MCVSDLISRHVRLHHVGDGGGGSQIWQWQICFIPLIKPPPKCTSTVPFNYIRRYLNSRQNQSDISCVKQGWNELKYDWFLTAVIDVTEGDICY